MFKKLTAVFVLCAITAVPLRSVLAGERGRAVVKGAKQFKLGELTLSVADASAKGDYLFRFSKNGEELFAGACAFKTHAPRTMRHTPLSDCRSLLAYCFSGGAHCCTTLFIATECGREVSLDMVDLGHTDREVKLIRADGAPGTLIGVQDWQLAYYGPEDSQIQLSFADSPAMNRLLVFDKGHWRADRVGEFSQFYLHLLRKAVQEAGISVRRRRPELTTASLAMKVAYYELMSGRTVEEASEALNRFFPARLKPETANIIRDICRAVFEFNPVEAIR